ncbi:hypothetical protein BJ742DRAFT_200311 [Cladochytrium replicatum]|nr:hypothetical protein BJ742DRAFT_200311 [Cladochytrium replicatum]
MKILYVGFLAELELDFPEGEYHGSDLSPTEWSRAFKSTGRRIEDVDANVCNCLPPPSTMYLIKLFLSHSKLKNALKYAEIYIQFFAARVVNASTANDLRKYVDQSGLIDKPVTLRRAHRGDGRARSGSSGSRTVEWVLKAWPLMRSKCSV